MNVAGEERRHAVGGQGASNKRGASSTCPTSVGTLRKRIGGRWHIAVGSVGRRIPGGMLVFGMLGRNTRRGYRLYEDGLSYRGADFIIVGGDFVRACGYGELVYFNGRILTILSPPICPR